MANSRLKILKNKKEIQIKQLRRELAQLLESGHPTARIRVTNSYLCFCDNQTLYIWEFLVLESEFHLFVAKIVNVVVMFLFSGGTCG